MAPWIAIAVMFVWEERASGLVILLYMGGGASPNLSTVRLLQQFLLILMFQFCCTAFFRSTRSGLGGNDKFHPCLPFPAQVQLTKRRAYHNQRVTELNPVSFRKTKQDSGPGQAGCIAMQWSGVAVALGYFLEFSANIFSANNAKTAYFCE